MIQLCQGYLLKLIGIGAARSSTYFENLLRAHMRGRSPRRMRSSSLRHDYKTFGRLQGL